MLYRKPPYEHDKHWWLVVILVVIVLIAITVIIVTMLEGHTASRLNFKVVHTRGDCSEGGAVCFFF